MYFYFFFNDTATTEIYTLSLHDALPISELCARRVIIATEIERVVEDREIDKVDPASKGGHLRDRTVRLYFPELIGPARSEEHTSELQSRQYLVCRLLLEKKKQ